MTDNLTSPVFTHETEHNEILNFYLLRDCPLYHVTNNSFGSQPR